jgi:hypothetical protein
MYGRDLQTRKTRIVHYNDIQMLVNLGWPVNGRNAYLLGGVLRPPGPPYHVFHTPCCDQQWLLGAAAYSAIAQQQGGCSIVFTEVGGQLNERRQALWLGSESCYLLVPSGRVSIGIGAARRALAAVSSSFGDCSVVLPLKNRMLLHKGDLEVLFTRKVSKRAAGK